MTSGRELMLLLLLLLLMVLVQTPVLRCWITYFMRGDWAQRPVLSPLLRVPSIYLTGRLRYEGITPESSQRDLLISLSLTHTHSLPLLAVQMIYFVEGLGYRTERTVYNIFFINKKKSDI